jgi:hypothetical protein
MHVPAPLGPSSLPPVMSHQVGSTLGPGLSPDELAEQPPHTTVAVLNFVARVEVSQGTARLRGGVEDLPRLSILSPCPQHGELCSLGSLITWG